MQTDINETPTETTTTETTAPEINNASADGPGEQPTAEAAAGKPTGLDALKNAAAAAENNAQAAKDGAPAPIPAAYNPNFKFKSFGKEYEIDEMFRGLIKDAETEKKVKSFFERAYGVDTMKSTNQKLKEEYSGFKEQAAQRDKALETLSGYVQKGDMHSFFQALKIPEEMVLQYALDRVTYKDMSPEQRAQVDAQHSIRNQATFLEQQNQTLTQQWQTEAARARTLELDFELSNPEARAAAEAYDARVNQPGAFKELVISEGQYHWHTSHQDIPAKQAIQMAISRYGLSAQQGDSNPTATPNFAGANQAPVTNQQSKPVIPNIRGSGTSPVKKVPGSLADLHKILKQKTAGG